MGYTIGEASRLLGIPATTLRYYDREGLLPFVERQPSGYRTFSDGDIAMLRVVECLKKTGMQIRDIKRFADLSRQGDASLEQRLEIFLERRRSVERQLAELRETLDLINYKCQYYETAVAAGTESIHKKKMMDGVLPEDAGS